ncbi:hypothetical protein GTZ78_08910 [Streptomyces sp. SID8361]|uniref:hypothetical protein n=1 Tax=Streptomyces sp. MnatMP-M27 TaxID=1839768 RepID=UPI00081EC525|nr:hypothetical protein [Streptomyces sp. MnatMP-M27]MYU10809.1 hypothetical protein [Streptomyces sp. SID8361]SCF75639.1 hypothetical protein GA0115260_102254 [Streptomyces sp. MnatMP-M27]
MSTVTLIILVAALAAMAGLVIAPSVRQGRKGDLPVRSLPSEAREQYAARWAGLQERFVDSPGWALREADRLLGALAVDRGYPAESDEKRMDALSVRHPREIEGYRRLHAMAARMNHGEGAEAATERMREALVAARPLFEQLVRAQPHDKRPLPPPVPRQRDLERGRIPRQRLGPAADH